jgi:hypothetical protein
MTKKLTQLLSPADGGEGEQGGDVGGSPSCPRSPLPRRRGETNNRRAAAVKARRTRRVRFSNDRLSSQKMVDLIPGQGTGSQQSHPIRPA